MFSVLLNELVQFVSMFLILVLVVVGIVLAFLGLCSSFRLLSFGNCQLLLTFGLWRLLFAFAFALAITFGFVDILISIVFQYIAKDYTTIQGDISTYYTEKCTRNVKYHVLHYLECVIVSI